MKDPIATLRALVDKSSLRKVAERLECSKTHLHDILAGRREIGPKVAAGMKKIRANA